MKRKKEELIPLEKSKKVIYLDRRGKGRKRPVEVFIFAALGIVCLLYCLSILFFMGYGTKFFLIWGAMAVVFGLFSVVLAHREWLEQIPFWVKTAFVVCSVIGILFFGTIEGMKGYLMQAGILEERILMEDQSTNTYQNLVYSGQLLDKEKDSVVLVTNNFHMFRALSLAKKQGYSQIEGQSAASYPGMVPNNLLREFFGVVKDFLVGNL